MSRLPVADRHKVDCGNCYGNGCGSYGNRGWVETEEGREEREEAEERRGEEMRERQMPGDD